MKMVDVLEQREYLTDLKKESPRKCGGCVGGVWV